MDDPYLDLIDEQWNNIAMMYDVFRDKKPIVEYDVDNKKIYTYPANDYIGGLTARTRNETQKQYEEACKNLLAQKSVGFRNRMPFSPKLSPTALGGELF